MTGRGAVFFFAPCNCVQTIKSKFLHVIFSKINHCMRSSFLQTKKDFRMRRWSATEVGRKQTLLIHQSAFNKITNLCIFSSLRTNVFQAFSLPSRNQFWFRCKYFLYVKMNFGLNTWYVYSSKKHQKLALIKLTSVK